jgi:hypothetical protein
MMLVADVLTGNFYTEDNRSHNTPENDGYEVDGHISFLATRVHGF